MVRIRLYLTADDVISRFNGHRFKTSPPFDPRDSLELLYLLWQCLWMSEFMKTQGYFNDNGPTVTKGEGRALSPSRVFLSRAHFLPGSWLRSEFLGMVKGWELLCVCKHAAATDLWTWHAWEYQVTMATTNMELNSISGRDSSSQTDNVPGLANCPQRRMWKLGWINFSSLGQHL